MAIYKCKMCGGTLEVVEGGTICECDSCGTRQTVPSTNVEEVQRLFNRANTLRLKCEFDKAEEIYEKIVNMDNTQAEAYWGILLCKYGIEYVEDKRTYTRIPTCHRTSYDAIVADENYKLALSNADSEQKVLYEKEAKYIDKVQKGILAISNQEEPYDIFICYKETDANGKRTIDSVIANDIYHQLTQEGFKVFYAAISLESKLGSEYEPIIFAALNSAKVMLAIGTKPEYFQSVWVKNEWSRYLKMLKNDKKKMLIPCYKDMDAYELPEEFAHLQAQDMSKIGFINDLVRGIKKVIKPEKSQIQTQQVIVNNTQSGNITALIKRAMLALEDGDFEGAKSQYDKMLDIDPENAQVYLVGLLCDLKVKNLEDIDFLQNDYIQNPNYKKLTRFADDKLRKQLDGLNDIFAEKEYKILEQEIYESGALQLDEVYKSIEKAIYVKNKKPLQELWQKQAYEKLLDKINNSNSMYYFDKIKKILNYLQSEEQRNVLNEIICEKTNQIIYKNACQAFETKDYSLAKQLFSKIKGYKDVDEKYEEVNKIASQIEKENEEKRIERAKILTKQQKKKKIIKIAIIIIAIAVFILFCAMPAIVSYSLNNARAGLKLDYVFLENETFYVVEGFEDKSDTRKTLVIPSEYRGIPIKMVGRGAFKGTNLEKVTIPSSVINIQEGAFSDCLSLNSVEFESVDNWRANNTNLSSVDIANEHTAAIYLKSTYNNCIWLHN